MKTAMPPRQETMLYRPAPPDADAVGVGMLYPYTYPVAMASLGYLMLSRQLDERPDVELRRITTDDMHAQAVSDLDLAGFSFSFELDILEVLRMLEHYEIPLMAAERPRDVPLFFAGGPVVMTNPEPYADFFDFFLIGEGEELLADLVVAYQRHRHLRDRRDLLMALAVEVPGVYVPSLYTVTYHEDGPIAAITPQSDVLPMPVQKRFVSDLDTVMASSPILSPEAVFPDTFLVEVMRGCAHRCRFCLASYSMLPARGPSLAMLQERITEGLKYTKKIGLLGALIADHPEFDALCDWLKLQEGIQISVASLRADTLTPHIAETIKHCGQHSITLAVESGSESVRKRINKHLKTEAIHQAAATMAQAGIPALKLYMMVGLPGETDADMVETIALVKALRKENPLLKINVGCSTFVPKAATPFQWLARLDTKTLNARQEMLRKGLVKTADFRPSSAKWDYVQALLSRGDRRLSRFLIAFRKQGANLGALNRTLKDLASEPEAGARLDLPALDWYALRERPEDEILPWDVLHLGVDKAVLYRESGLMPTIAPADLVPVTVPIGESAL